jgi:hypothetical protein
MTKIVFCCDNEVLFFQYQCNVPIFGFPYYAVRFTLGGLIQPGQRGETMTSERSEDLEEFCGAQINLFTFIHHQDHFRTTCLWFRCIPKIPVKRVIIEHILIKFTKDVILGIIFEEAP